MHQGNPDEDVSGVRVDRFKPYQSTLQYRSVRAPESLGKVYATHFPNSQYKSAREGLLSPLFARQCALGAHFRDVSGWESPDYYRMQPGEQGGAAHSFYAPEAELSFGRPRFWDKWQREHRAVRERVALIDMSFMCKFIVAGPDAAYVLERCSTARVSDNIGETVYTQWLDEKGFLQADVTVTRLEDEKFMVVSTDTMHRHTQAWVRRVAAAEGRRAVVVLDVTSSMSKARSHRHFFCLLSFFLCRSTYTAPRPVNSCNLSLTRRAICPTRVSRSGPLGRSRLAWQSCLPFASPMWASWAGSCMCPWSRVCTFTTSWWLLAHSLASRTQVRATSFLVVSCVYCVSGLRTLGSCRMEKGYRDYGTDIDNTDNIIDTGLSFTCALDKPVPFIGFEAVKARKDLLAGKAPSRRLVQVLCTDPDPLLFHGDLVLRDGIVVGDFRSASYGHTLKGAVGLSMVERPGKPVSKEWLEQGVWEVEQAGVRYPALASAAPLYDPKNEKIRA